MSIFNSMKPEGGSKLHPFDLSRRDIFSAKSGVLNPILCLHTIPESKYDVTHAQITRTDPIQSAPFARMSENYEYYFVPYSQIFHDFERIYYERGDQQRNVGGNSFGSQTTVSSMLPNFNYGAVISNLAKYYVASRIYLKCKEQENLSTGFLLTNFNVYQPTDWIIPFDVHGHICIDEMLKLFDNLGYGNIYALFNTTLAPFFSGWSLPYIFTVEVPDIDSYNAALLEQLKSVFGYDSENSSFVNYPAIALAFYDNFKIIEGSDDPHYNCMPNWRANYSQSLKYLFNVLCDTFIDYFVNGANSVYTILSHKIQDYYSYHPNVLNIAAYLKVFSDIYRNSQFDNDNYSDLYNFDYVTQDELALIPANKICQMLIPRFRQYKKDVFNGGFANAQFGSVAVTSLQNPSRISNNTKYTTSNSSIAGVMSPDNKLVLRASEGGSVVAGSDSWTIETGISALAVRQALSLQRYKERILRAGNRLTALQTAVFGDRSRFIEDSYVKFIGAESNNIDFNSVAATSDAGKSEVGQLGSNGVGTHIGKAFEYHSHDFGVIIGIYYILPESEYESYMIDPMLTKTETNDFYKPDFMNLGLSPVWNYNYNVLSMSEHDYDVILSYLANYWEYKTSIDKVHGNFYSSIPLQGQVDGVSMPAITTASAFVRGQNSWYVTPRSALDMISGLSLGVLYVNPHDIDTIFYVDSDFTLDTDQFKVNCNHDIKALLPMSVVGLPEF